MHSLELQFILGMEEKHWEQCCGVRRWLIQVLKHQTDGVLQCCMMLHDSAIQLNIVSPIVSLMPTVYLCAVQSGG